MSFDIRYPLAILLLLLSACSGKGRNENQPDPGTSDSLYSASAESEANRPQPMELDELESDQTKTLFPQFMKLVKENRSGEALDFYLHNQEGFANELESCEKIYRFSDGVIIPMINIYKDSVEAKRELLRIHSFNSKYFESVNQMRGDDSETSAEYLQTLGLLAISYARLNEFDQGLKISDKLLKLLEKVYGRNCSDYANTLFNRANILAMSGKMVEARHTYLDAKELYEKLGMQDSGEYMATINKLSK